VAFFNLNISIGQFCEISMDHCELMPCEEGSACRTVNGTWQCFCKSGFLGRHCNLLPCDWLPCPANAICVNLKEENATRESYRWQFCKSFINMIAWSYNWFRCDCPDGYAGENCTTRINHCEILPCLNNGNCINHVNNYTCDCHILFTGRNCEIGKLTFHFNIKNINTPRCLKSYYCNRILVLRS